MFTGEVNKPKAAAKILLLINQIKLSLGGGGAGGGGGGRTREGYGTVNRKGNMESGSSKREGSEGEAKNVQLCHLLIRCICHL